MVTAKPSVESIFIAAVEYKPDERAAFLDKVCGSDGELRARIERLLSAHPDTSSFLESPAPELGATTIDCQFQEKPGTAVGSYKLLEQIGEGGFGVVFLAEQERPVKRLVALKIIKPGMDTREVITRFEAERQALALMDHPNIAKVHEAGATETGRPYFVMELVQGVSITDYCDQCNLSTDERLELFITVCQAVQHAHQKGVIHRDIKPTNVLVAIQDGRPAPKIIDFGVAKALNQRLTERTLMTAFAQLVGTPLYMSPEQAELSPLGVDTRSDIYSLGVLLYELLTGTTPLDKERIQKASYDELRRIIREEEPPRPSARLSTLKADLAATVAEQRRTDPRRLRQTVRGELDWIVMKCLEKDRNRRYETPNSLARDVERYLHDEPVQACPPSASYRLRKLVRRNRVAVVASSTVILALVAGAALATTGFVQARRQARIAVTEAAKATAISDLLQKALQSANPDMARGTNYTVRQLLDEISKELGGQFDDDEVEATLHVTIGTAYRRLSLLADAERHIKSALELKQRLYGSDHPEVAAVLAEYGWILSERDEFAAAESRLHNALEIHRKLGIRNDATINILGNLQLTLNEQGKYGDAEAVAEEAGAIADALSIQPPVLARIMHEHARSAFGLNKLAKAERLARQAVRLHRQLNGADHPETGWGLFNLGGILSAQQRFSDAEQSYREALAIFREQFDESHGSVALATEYLEATLLQKGDVKELEKLHTDIGAHIAQQADAAIGAATARIVELSNLLLSRTGKKLAADRLYRGAFADFKDTLARRPPAVFETSLRAVLYARLGDVDKYRDICQSMVVRFSNSALATDRFRLAWVCSLCPNAVADLSVPVQHIEKVVAENPRDALYQATLGAALYRAGRYDEAARQLEESISAFPDDNYPKIFLAMTWMRTGREAEAAHLLSDLQPATEKELQNPNTLWFRRATLEMLRAEAESLIKPREADETVENHNPTPPPDG